MQITDRKAWLEERRKGICATDIAAISGIHPYKTALEVYVEKTEGTDKDLSDNEAVEWGLRLEEVIATKYAESHGVELTDCGLVVHPDTDWRRATPDRLVVGEDRGVEVKTAGIRQAARWGEEQTDQVPEEYLVQVAWQCATLGYDTWDIAVLLAGQEYREYRLHRDTELEAGLIQLGHDFWTDHVLKRIPPPLDGSDSARAYLLGRFPRNVEPLLTATPEAEEWAGKLREAKDRIAEAEADEARAKQELMAIIGDHDGIEGDFGKIYWRLQAGRASWKSIAEALNPPAELIEKHTGPGTRVFRPYWKKGA